MNKSPSTPKILHLIETTGQGGAETVLIQLASRMNGHFAPLVGVPKKEGWLVDRLRSEGVPLLFLKTGGSYDVKLLRNIIRAVRENKVDLIHAHMFTTGFYAALAGRLLTVPVMVTLHGTVDIGDSTNVNGKTRFKIELLDKLADKVVVVSEFMRSYCEGLGFCKRKLEAVHNGVDLDRFARAPDKTYRYKLGFSDEDKLIGAIGNIRKPKGYPHYIHAAGWVVEQVPEAKFLLVGQGNGSLEYELHRLVEQIKLKDRFFFLGHREDIPEILSALDVFVLPSTSEGFSIATIEAMAMGVPVAATRSGGPGEIVTDRQNGLLVPPADPRALSEALIELVRDEASIQRYVEAAYSTVKAKFSLRSQLMRYASLYSGLIR